MQGRILGIKKSNILACLFVFVTAGFLASSILSIFVFKLYYLWFFIFCLACGIFQLVKGLLFKFDSSFYFGFLLLMISAVGFYTTFGGSGYYASVYYILSFASASYFTFVFFNQKFHLYLSILIYFASLAWLLVKINIISIPIFVAIVVSGVLLFVLGYTLINKMSAKRR